MKNINYNKNKYIKSPLNYIGGKYKLLNKIIPIFPNKINNFVDLFCGGLNVGINANAKKIVAVDNNRYVIEILTAFKNNNAEIIIKHVENRIKQFDLSPINEQSFLSFRDYYNLHKNPLDLYTLTCHSFNHQFRFNSNGNYNNAFGRNKSSFSEALKQKLIIFVEELHKKEIDFVNLDFQYFNFNMLTHQDFVYCDPPYLITNAVYNKNWDIDKEQKLLELLDNLNCKGIPFALSNVITHKDKTNNLILEWSKKYTVHYMDYSYNYCCYNTKKGKSNEVLITNVLKK